MTDHPSPPARTPPVLLTMTVDEFEFLHMIVINGGDQPHLPDAVNEVLALSTALAEAREQQEAAESDATVLRLRLAESDFEASQVLHRYEITQAELVEAREELEWRRARLEEANNTIEYLKGQQARAEAAASRLREVQDERDTLHAAVVAFLAKWEVCLPAIESAFMMSQIHGMPYSGPTLEQELDALKALAPKG